METLLKSSSLEEVRIEEENEYCFGYYKTNVLGTFLNVHLLCLVARALLGICLHIYVKLENDTKM